MTSESHSASGALRVAVIGYGGAYNMGRRHLEQMRAAGMVPTAVCELDPSRLEVAGADFPGIEQYSSVEELVSCSKADLVTIITPHNTHASLAMQCLKAGKHVICEKPFALTTEECDEIISLAKAKGLLATAYHNRHWDGWILGAIDAVSRGAVGEVLHVVLQMNRWGMPKPGWRSSRLASGGIAYDWGVHLLEYALQVTGSEPLEVTGFSREGYWSQRHGHPCPGDANEDELSLVARMKGGASISLKISSLEPDFGAPFMTIHGTDGVYSMDWNHWELRQPQADASVRFTRGVHPTSRWEEFYRNIGGHLQGEEELIISPELSRLVIHLLDLGGQSARQGRTLPVVSCSNASHS